MIEVKDVYKSFDGFQALKGLSLSVPKGSVYGLVGPNGAGKSTIIRHIAGIYRQDAGEVLIDGQEVFENPSVKRRIAYIPDEIFYYTQASVRDMMKFYRDMYPSFDMQRYEELGAAFQMDDKRSMRKRQRVCRSRRRFALRSRAGRSASSLTSRWTGSTP